VGQQGTMVKLRLRTKFLLSMIVITASLTSTSLLLVRRSVQAQVRRGIVADLHNSVSTFQNFQREREITLSHSADLLADLPNVRALMTTQDETTIQDGSTDVWRLAGSDLLVLADRTGRVVALHTESPGFTRAMAQDSFSTELNQEGPGYWWYGAQHLYEVFLKPIYFGQASDNRLLGFVLIGHEIDDRVAAQVSRIAASQVAFYYDDNIVRSTLNPSQEAELRSRKSPQSAQATTEPESVQLGDEQFLGTSLELAGGKSPSVRLTVLKSYDRASAFIDNLNRLLLALGLTAVVGGSALVFLISHTFTRPLGSLVNGVRALEQGDFSYALDARGGDEVAEVTGAFDRMRTSLLRTQQQLLEAERLATIGRMASSISHDLRHSLAAIVANAEFLCESRLTSDQREELYQEVRVAVNQMTDLIDSLLEFSRTREALRRSFSSVKDCVEHVVQSLKAHPDFHRVQVTVSQFGSSTGWFDSKKLERVFYNLLLNACEAVVPGRGCIDVELREIRAGIEIRVIDNGRGVPESVRNSLFEPFISYGKENGTGLGLTVVQKIVQDHGGEVFVERTSDMGTVFKVTLPLTSSRPHGLQGEGKIGFPPLATTERVEPE
jgi:signal transduction histidine kinase